jgi:hypothetical protein
MKQKTKVLLSFAALSILWSLSFSSCQKSGSFDSYYYLTKPLSSADPASSASLNVDGANYGTIQFIASPVTAQSTGLNHVKLPFGRHNYTVYDSKNKAIISGYITYDGNSMGTGSCGPAGGGDSCGSTGSNGLLVGLFK